MLDLSGLDIDSQRPVYANTIDMVANEFEIRLAFYMASPRGPRLKVAEIIMAPIVAKVLTKLMPERIKMWEDANGYINLPDDVALLESLFGVKLQPRQGPPPDEPPKE
mgnify:CR=1 FL=1